MKGHREETGVENTSAGTTKPSRTHAHTHRLFCALLHVCHGDELRVVVHAFEECGVVLGHRAFIRVLAAVQLEQLVAAQILERLDGCEGEKVCVGDGGETKLYECE